MFVVGVWDSLQSNKSQLSHRFWVRGSVLFRQVESDMIKTHSQWLFKGCLRYKRPHKTEVKSQRRNFKHSFLDNVFSFAVYSAYRLKVLLNSCFCKLLCYYWEKSSCYSVINRQKQPLWVALEQSCSETITILGI